MLDKNNAYDWRRRRRWKYPYKGIEDPNYIKAKKETFQENGNGWWVYIGVASHLVPKGFRKNNH